MKPNKIHVSMLNVPMTNAKMAILFGRIEE